MSYFNLVPTDFDRASGGDQPHEYAALAQLVSLSGFAIKGRYPTRGSEAERRIKADDLSWLTGS